MVSDNVHRLQDTFLKHLQKQKTPVTVFLINGVKLQGVVADFDAFCVLLERDGQSQIVYKHAISTALPAYAVDLREDAADGEHVDQSKPPAPKPAVVVERVGRPRFGRS